MTLGPIRLASFDFDPRQMTLAREGTIVSLGRREGAILCALLARRGEVVTKQALMDAAWPGLAREESNLSVQVAHLRRRLGPGLIRTVERIGYQLLAAADAPPAVAVAAAMGRSVTIRPFAVTDEAPGLAATAAQMTEDLALGLVRFPALTVVAPSAGRHCRYTVGGSVRSAAGRLRVAVNLVDTITGAMLWADAFTAGARQLAKACEEVVPRIVAAIDSELQMAEIARSRRDRPDSADAYDLYLRAEYLLRTSNIHDNAAAIALYEKAVACEPENVALLAGACAAMHHRIAMGWPALTPDDAQRCHAYAIRGLGLARRDGDAMALFGIAIMMTGDPDLGYATMQRAAATNPNSLHAVQVAGQANLHWGDLDQAEEQLVRAYRLNPGDHSQRFIVGTLARIKLCRGDVAGAAALARHAFAINQHYNPTHWTLIATAAHLGRAEQAARYLAHFTASNPGVTLARIAHARPSVGNRNASLLEGLEAAGLG